MPVKRRIAKQRDDYPKPWEEHPVSLERWMRHRERMLASHISGRRPHEWWEYESPIPWPGYDNEAVALYDVGLLSEEEIAELMPRWREEFERANRKDFFYVAGPKKYLTGAPARKAHYKWANIPPAVLKELTAGSSRRAEK